MKYVTEYRNKQDAKAIAECIAREVNPNRLYRFMEFCGGHTHVLARWGIAELLPKNIQFLHGPGCPVCVLPVGRLELAFECALEHNAIVCTYGDLLRVPARNGRSLFSIKSAGGDIRMIYSPMDALSIARANPEREVVFFAIGFETTAPATAVVLAAAKKEGIQNFSVLCSHVLTPAAMTSIVTQAHNPEVPFLDGLIGPAHVSTVIGVAPYREFAQRHGIPVVICGFEPQDMLMTTLMLVRMVNEGRHDVENEFTRAVTENGNTVALDLMKKVFVRRTEFAWRGLGIVPESALAIAPDYAQFDTERRFALHESVVADNPACECGAVLRGEKTPEECKAFGKICTPSHPIGACMVSSEGACAAFYSYERHRPTHKKENA